MVGQSDKPVVVITGARAGIGDAIARKFGQGGFRVVAVARRQDRLEQLAKELSSKTDVKVLAADVAATDAPKRAIELAMNSFGRVDCLINNAGSGKWAPVHQTDDDMMNEVIDISLKAPF